jgi:hypothetical protein
MAVYLRYLTAGVFVPRYYVIPALMMGGALLSFLTVVRSLGNAAADAVEAQTALAV